MIQAIRSKHFIYGMVLLLFIVISSSTAYAGEVTLSWNAPTTNEDGTPLTDLDGYIVYYGTASGSYSQDTNVGNVTTYQVTGLTDGATYYFSVTAYDTSGNESAYANENSKYIPIPDTTSPVISAVQSSGITLSSAVIAWTTDETSDTQIEYGTTSSYGSTTALNTSMVTSHTQSLSNLSASTLYHYRVRSRDAAGNLGVSGDYTFTTADPPDIIPPAKPLALVTD